MATPDVSASEAARSPYDYLRIFLADHHAGARAGIELVRRMIPSNEGTPLGSYLRDRLLAEVENDLGTLEDVMAAVGAGPQWWKDAAAWAAERVGRLKPNGQLRGYSPLSRVVELEALTIAITGKRMLWETLKDLAPGDSRLAAYAFDDLIGRAEIQRAEVEKHHAAAARAAFARPG